MSLLSKQALKRWSFKNKNACEYTGIGVLKK